jgi:hypothetical protein
VVILAATFCLSVAGFLGALALRDGGASDVRLPRIPAWSDVAARLGLGGKDEPSTAAPGAAESAASPSPEGEVSGRFEEANVGEFDLVDGIAHRAADGRVVVFAVSEPIASAALAGSPCPATQARALALLRAASWNEVALDDSGDSPYFAYGAQYGAQGRANDPDGHYVSGDLELEDGRVEGRARHEDYGGFEFDLPLHTPAMTEPSQGERFDNRVWLGNRVPGTYEAFLAYDAIRRAALARDLDALLAAQGFTGEQIAAVRALPGIEAELAAHADRFLTTDELSAEDEISVDQGFAQVIGVGDNPHGLPFFNVYELAPCGEALVMVGIYLNPQ